MISVKTIRGQLRREPFLPFRVVMSDRLSYEVLRRELALLTQRDLVVGVDAGEDGIPAEIRICSLQ